MFNLLNSPIENETLSAWAKITDDLAKVAIIATPAIIYSENTLFYKISNLSLLIIFTYFMLSIGRILRK